MHLGYHELRKMLEEFSKRKHPALSAGRNPSLMAPPDAPVAPRPPERDHRPRDDGHRERDRDHSGRNGYDRPHTRYDIRFIVGVRLMLIERSAVIVTLVDELIVIVQDRLGGDTKRSDTALQFFTLSVIAMVVNKFSMRNDYPSTPVGTHCRCES